MRAVFASLLLLLLLPAAAPAQVASAGKMTHDEQWSRFTLPMTCTSETGACVVPVTVTYQFTGPYPKFERLGSPTVADSTQVTVPAGTHDVVVETAKVIEGIARRGGSFWVEISAGEVEYSSFGNYSKVGFCGKGTPLLLGYKGPGKLYFAPDKTESFGRTAGYVTRSTFMTQGTTYQVRDGSVSYSYKGVTYSFAKGSEFIITCTGNTSVKGGASVLSPMLERGSVRVSATKRRMRQPAAWVMTGEGNLGTRARETASFTVSRNAARKISTLAMKKGRAGTITPWNTVNRSPCRAGQKLRVNARGRIS